MKNFQLINGMRVLFDGVGGDTTYSLSLTVNVGHLNALPGLAKVFEEVLVRQAPDVRVEYGGTITSYLDKCAPTTPSLLAALRRMATMIKFRDFRQEVIDAVAAGIVDENQEMALVPSRLMKLRYKHTAFAGADKVWSPDVYNAAVTSYRVEDLKNFAGEYLTGRNMVLVISGRNIEKCLLEVYDKVKELFGEGIPAGEKAGVENHLYTGGYARFEKSGYTGIMLGWDISSQMVWNVPEINVLMSLLSRMLELQFAEQNVDVEVKIAGYYGMRTLRVFVSTRQKMNPKNIFNILLECLSRLKKGVGESIFERARSVAMAEKRAAYSQPQSRSVEIAWQLLGRGIIDDFNERLFKTGTVEMKDCCEVGRDIFMTKPTCVVCAKSEAEFYTYDEVLSMLKG